MMIAILALVGRLLLAAALLAPHGVRAEQGGLTLVICGAEGTYEIALPSAPAAPHADRHDCCLGFCAPFVAAPTVAVVRSAPVAAAPSPHPVAAVDVSASVFPPPARAPPFGT